MVSIGAGIEASLWLCGLWSAAGNFERTSSSPATRIRNTILVGVAIPLVLSSVGLLTATASWSVLVALVVIERCRPNERVRVTSGPENLTGRLGRALPTIAVIAVAWPALVRPLLQGDSLGYHLPNAASWGHDHTLWITNTTYWWYPGGSEMFAAGLDRVAGPLAVAVSGTIALLLLGQRLYEFGERRRVDALVSGSLSAVAVTTAVVALQSANLENDVWLSAFALEIVWCLTYERTALAANSAMCALLKPFGAIFAICGLVLGRARLREVIVAMIPLAFWGIRDAILWRSALVDPASTRFPHMERTTILAQGVDGLRMLFHVVARQDVGFWLIVTVALVALVRSRIRSVQILTAVGLAFFFVAPFGFRNDLPQLATGQSLRYALPALVVGFSEAFWPTRLPRWLCVAILVPIAIVQAYSNYAIFANDSTTVTIVIALVVAIPAMLLPLNFPRRWAEFALATFLLSFSMSLAGSHPADYFNDWLGSNAHPSRFFNYIANLEPRRIVVWQLRQGAINVVAPQLETFDVAANTDPCSEAKRLHAYLLVSNDPQTTPDVLASRRARARACGSVRYDDRVTLLVDPAADGSVRIGSANGPMSR